MVLNNRVIYTLLFLYSFKTTRCKGTSAMGIDFSWSNTACEHLDIISIHKHKYFSTNFNKEYAKLLHTNVRVNSE